jgi:predicted HTH domain antitoxin
MVSGILGARPAVLLRHSPFACLPAALLYHDPMQLSVPDDLLSGQDLSERDLLLHLALGLFIDDRASLGRAARIAGMSVPAFVDELGKRKIPVHYDRNDLEADLRTIRSLEQKGGEA